MAKRVPYLHEEQIERDAAALLADYERSRIRVKEWMRLAMHDRNRPDHNHPATPGLGREHL